MNLQTSQGLRHTSAWILAGGQGKRLHPLTVSRPKPAVSFGGSSRIIDFTLLNCFKSGVSRVSLLTQYRHEELHQYIRQEWNERWNSGQNRTPLVCLPPASGKRYRGTADAMFRNLELLESDDSDFVLILSGDHIYQMDYRDLVRRHMEKDADLTIAAVEHPLKEASSFGVLEVDANFKVTGFAEKPASPAALPSRPSMALVSMGIYVFKKNVLRKTLRSHCEGRGYDFGHDIIPSMIPFGRTYAYDFRAYWRDIGTIDAYYQASMDIPIRSARIYRESRILNSVISPDVHIAEGATIEDSVLLPGVRIGKGVRLRRTIVEEGVRVSAELNVGFDLDRDRDRHTVTREGVVVIHDSEQNALGFTA
jgi:glucose-1-phosphate adenylyltransferase